MENICFVSGLKRSAGGIESVVSTIRNSGLNSSQLYYCNNNYTQIPNKITTEKQEKEKNDFGFKYPSIDNNELYQKMQERNETTNPQIKFNTNIKNSCNKVNDKNSQQKFIFPNTDNIPSIINKEQKKPENINPLRYEFPVLIDRIEDISTEENAIKMYETLEKANEKNKIDILHIHSPNLLGPMLCCAYAKENNIPVITTYHYGKRREGTESEELIRQTISLTDHLVCVSKASEKVAKTIIKEIEEEKKELKEDKSLIKTSIIYNGIDIDNFLRNPNYTKKDNIFRMIYPAAICYEKGQDDLVDILSELHKKTDLFKLTLIGRVSDPIYKSMIITKAMNNNILEHIEFKTSIPYEFMPQEYSNKDLLLFPSHEEGLGLISLEAQASGIPVIAYSCGGIPETIKDKETGFIIPFNDKKQFTEKIYELMTNQNILKDFKINSYEHLRDEKKFHKKTMAQNYKSLYEKIIKDRYK
jgi:glycosyltransferase involved in cell wall biosynthesis